MVISLQVTCCTRIAGAFTTFILRGTGFMNSTLTNHISKYVYVHFDKQGILGFCNTLVCVQVVLYCWGGRGGGVPRVERMTFTYSICFQGIQGQIETFLGVDTQRGQQLKDLSLHHQVLVLQSCQRKKEQFAY